MTRVIMHGCNGKMGQMIAGLIAQDEEVKLVAGVDVYDQGKNPFPVYKHISDCDVQADVIIDFCNPAAIKGLMEYCVERQIPCVVCTTGLSEEELNYVREASKKVAILRSANMSLGINMLLKLLKEATGILAPAGFDIEIVEKHHNLKLDAPSGTARTLGHHLGIPEADYPAYIASLRMGNVFGQHTVYFAMEDEVLEIRHTAYSKRIFALGALEAGKQMVQKNLKQEW